MANLSDQNLASRPLLQLDRGSQPGEEDCAGHLVWSDGDQVKAEATDAGKPGVDD
jgi:hypothetical protein